MLCLANGSLTLKGLGIALFALAFPFWLSQSLGGLISSCAFTDQPAQLETQMRL